MSKSHRGRQSVYTVPIRNGTGRRSTRGVGSGVSEETTKIHCKKRQYWGTDSSLHQIHSKMHSIKPDCPFKTLPSYLLGLSTLEELEAAEQVGQEGARRVKEQTKSLFSRRSVSRGQRVSRDFSVHKGDERRIFREPYKPLE